MLDRPPRCCSMHDPSGRRGIWYGIEDGVFKVFAGREGDDASIELRVGDSLTERTIAALELCLGYGACQQEDNGPDAPPPAGKFRSGTVVDE